MSQLVLKIIAVLAMLIDHAGLIFFPQYRIFRILGRLAFPIFAYCIAEGFLYTRNKLKYFSRVLVLGVLCQLVYDIAEGDIYLGILITFSISIIIMYFADCFKKAFAGDNSSVSTLIKKITKVSVSLTADRIISGALLAMSVAAAFVLTMYVEVDYGFFGIMLPVFTSLYSDKTRRFFMFTAGLIALCLYNVYCGSMIQLWSLFTVPILALYNGRPGKYRLKYFFYIFYPAHLAILYLIDMIIKGGLW